ncbi:MAG TPA: diguanylate cyclase, partial [Steroidobacteraceae bacterium]
MQIGFAAVVALLLIVATVEYRSLGASTNSARWVHHTGDVLEHLALLRTAAENIESGYLDFALTGDDAFLQLSRTRISLLESEQSVLRTLAADNPVQQRRLGVIADLEQRIAQLSDTIVRIRKTEGVAPAVDVIRKGQGDPVLDEFRAIAGDMQAEERRLLHERADTEERRHHQTTNALMLGSALAIFIAILSGWLVLRDRAQRWATEDELRSLNRLYAMVSGINALGIKLRDRDELFRDACRIAVQQGEFVMAWIGVVDHFQKKIVPIAWAGVDDQTMGTIRAHFSTSAGSLDGTTLAARASRGLTAIVANDVQNDRSLAFGTMHARAGVRSIAVLPLVIASKAIGVFALYTNKPEFFDTAGLLLLTELASNVAFAIDHLQKQERLDRFAYYDDLTGLANRSLFIDRVTQHMLSATAGGHKLAVFLIDLERFKKFNDSLGRPAGDALLKQVAEWLALNSGNVNLLARVGADQFAMVMPEVTYEADVLRLLEKRIAGFMNQPFRVNDAVYRIAAKVGVVLFPDDGTDADTLFKNA